MSSVPEWKQDIEFVQEIMRSQDLGAFDDVREPLPSFVTDRGCCFRAYSTAFMGWLGVTRAAMPIDSVAAELKSRFPCIIPETRQFIADHAQRDLAEIDNVGAIVQSWQS